MGALCGLSAKENGCKRHTPPGAYKPATEVRPAQYLLKKLQSRDLTSVHAINAQARVLTQGNGQAISVNVNILWKRDSSIWMNVKKFGLEAARVLIRPDSVFVINRIDKTWTAKSMEQLQSEYSLPDGFGFLQQFLLAAAWISPDMELKSDIKDKLHRLSGDKGLLSADYRLEEGSFLLRSETFIQSRDARNITFSFDNYKKTPIVGFFPYLRHVEAFSPETDKVILDIELSNVEINTPKNFRFEIPSSYEKAD